MTSKKHKPDGKAFITFILFVATTVGSIWQVGEIHNYWGWGDLSQLMLLFIFAGTAFLSLIYTIKGLMGPGRFKDGLFGGLKKKDK